MSLAHAHTRDQRATLLTADAYAALASEADTLARACPEPNVFALPGPADAAARAFGGRAVVATAWQGTALSGAWPLAVRKPRWGGPAQLMARAHEYTVLSTPLLEPDAPLTAVTALVDALGADRSLPALLAAPFLVEDGPAAAALVAHARDTGRRVAVLDRYERAVLPPGPGAVWLAGVLSGPRGRTLRKERRRLETLGATTERHPACREPDAFERFLAMEAAGWKGRAGTAIASDSRALAFMRALAAEPGRADVYALTVDGRAIAMGLVLWAGGRAFFHKITYDEGHARLSPGTHLALGVSQALLTTPGFKGADSCVLRGAGMLDGLWNERQPMVDVLLELRPTGAAFPMAVAAERAWRAAHATAKAAWHRWRAALP